MLLYHLADNIENNLHCFVYLECDNCCFIPYAYYDDVVGEINIDGSLNNINRLIALAHEVGHLLDESKTTNSVQIELNAWHLGYKYMLMESIYIDPEEYFDKMYECLSEYIEVN
tara:strand:+ start:368 stop:709 length:342 start_codon:yes stop_codon:yes gene_type:complete